MADFNTLNFGNTEDINLEGGSLEDFLNGDTSKIEKIDSKKEAKKAEVRTPVKKEKEQSTEETDDEEEQSEEKVDILNALSEEETEEEEEKKKPVKKQEEEAEEEQEVEDNPFEVISRQLYDSGIFLQDEDEEPVVASSPEELLQLFQANSQKSALRQLDNFLRSRGDNMVELFQRMFVDGVDPKEYLPVYNRMQDFESLDITDETNQEKVFREYYKRAGLSDSLIEKKLQKAKDYGDLEEEVQDLHPKLVEQDKEELEAQKLQKQQEEQLKKQNEQAYQQNVQKILVEAVKQKEIAGFPITESKAREAAQYLLQPKYRLPNGDVISEFDKYFLESKKPENLKDRVAFAVLKLNNFDFSKIEKKAVSKDTNELFSGLKKKSVKSKTEKVTQNNSFWDAL